MERITYRKTLDVHKNGVQFVLQGFETADKMSRVIEISLMASGDAIDFPLERTVAMMYVTTPSATEPSINECTIKDNKVVYNVLPIVEEGITTMQLKIIETGPDGATSVLASPKFSVEVTDSGMNDDGEELKASFTAIEDFIAKAEVAYGKRLEKIELSNDCIFYAYYADGTYYETDILRKLFLNGNVELSKSYAMGGTGVRAGEDTDNSKYYSSVAKSEAINAKDIMANSEEVLEEVKLHGMYTAFSVDFETGEVEYVSPSFKFNINLETGELDAIGQTYTFNDEVGRVVEEWLEARGILLSELNEISKTHSGEIKELQETVEGHTENLESLNNLQETVESHTENLESLNGIRPVPLGGTGLDIVPDESFLVGAGADSLVAITPYEALTLLRGAKIKCGTYNGFPGYGENYPVRLSFDFTPYLVIVQRRDWYTDWTIMINGANQAGVPPFDYNVNNDLTLTWGQDYVEWYNSSSNNQLSNDGKTYHYVAIGLVEP